MSWAYRLQNYNFLVSDIFVNDVGLEATAGFLGGWSGTYPLVGEAGSWPSGGQGHD